MQVRRSVLAYQSLIQQEDDGNWEQRVEEALDADGPVLQPAPSPEEPAGTANPRPHAL